METGAKLYDRCISNLAGKWVRLNYNSAIGTFCNNIANDLPITMTDPNVEQELLFIDDLIEEMYNLLEGHPHGYKYPEAGTVVSGVEDDGLTLAICDDGRYCCIMVTHKATLGYIAECLRRFHDQPSTLIVADLPGSP